MIILTNVYGFYLVMFSKELFLCTKQVKVILVLCLNESCKKSHVISGMYFDSFKCG